LAHFSPATRVRSDVIDDTRTKAFVAPVQQTPIVVVIPPVSPSRKQAWFVRERGRFGTELDGASAQETHDAVDRAAVREIIVPLPEVGLFTSRVRHSKPESTGLWERTQDHTKVHGCALRVAGIPQLAESFSLYFIRIQGVGNIIFFGMSQDVAV
jgi:hypothetical protein